MPDILLIQPPIRDFYLTMKRTIPYGLACIAAALISEGFSVEILDALATAKSKPLDFPPELAYLKPFYKKPDISPFALFHQFRHFGYSFQHIEKQVRESGAFLVGISSLFTAYSNEALMTAEIARTALPNCHIVMGGHHPTAMPRNVMACEAVDFVIRGEGEVSMPVLACLLKNQSPDIQAQALSQSLSSIPGIVFRKSDTSLHISEPAMMEHPDAYPLPALELIKHSFYKRRKKGSAVIVASRGCPMKCTYCSVGASGLKYRRRSVASVIREIDMAVSRYDAGFIDFEDENISLEKEWFLKLLHDIAALYPELELRAMNGLFPPSLDEEVIHMMKTAGFRTLNLSLGSASGAQLRKFQRPDVRKSLERAVRIARKYGLETVCYIIAGAPGQSAKDSIADLFYLARQNVLAGVSIFYPAPGSPDFSQLEKSGLLPEHFSQMRSAAIPISHTTTRLELLTILRLARLLNFMTFLEHSGEEIPLPSPFIPGKSIDISDRNTVGKQLLAWFCHDGKIRGITPEGEIYEHMISTELTRAFIEGYSDADSSI